MSFVRSQSLFIVLLSTCVYICRFSTNLCKIRFLWMWAVDVQPF